MSGELRMVVRVQAGGDNLGMRLGTRKAGEMADRPLGQVKQLRQEVARLEALLALHQGGFREVRDILERLNGGSHAEAIRECERFVGASGRVARKPVT